jgi:uncharacterized protein YciI
MLGRTMWEFTGSTANHRRFLILGRGRPGLQPPSIDLRDEHRRYLLDGEYRANLIACGPLLSDDGLEWEGTVTLIELPDRASAEALPAHDPYSRAGLYDSVEVHPWRFGGRPKP